MTAASRHFDVVVIGSGPAGQKAAIQCAKLHRRVVIVERLQEIGGACVHQGTIPSKALRERALERRATRGGIESGPINIAELIGEMGEVVRGHDRYMTAQLERNGITIVHGMAEFTGPHDVAVTHTDGRVERLHAPNLVIATGSKPRQPPNVRIDHENVYDSDSILSLAYLPQSLVVLGGGVIASEYASIFSVLGVKVTVIDRAPRPLGFVDEELVGHFVTAFNANGGEFIGNATVDAIESDGVSRLRTRLGDGRIVEAEKVLCALGRESVLDGLHVERAGVTVNERHLIEVNAFGQTSAPHIYAAGDVIGPPSLASAAMEQGRRAACHLLGIDAGRQGEWLPSGIYAVPEMASVGLSEHEVRRRHGDVWVGRASYSEIARGHISGAPDGMLKLVASPDRVVRGVHIVGALATEMIHIGQMGLIHDATVDTYVENVFNFPTFAESYRVAALQITGQVARPPLRATSR